MSEINFLTECQKCEFNYRPLKNGSDCDFDRIEKFRQSGATVELDEETDSYKIDRFCNRYLQFDCTISTLEARKIALDKSAIKVDVIVYAAAHNEISDIRETLDSLALQNPLPNSVKIVLNDPDFNPMEIWTSINEMDLPYRWNFWTPAPDRAPLDIVDDVVKKFSGQFYAVFDAGHFVRKDFLNRLEYAFNEELKVFNVVLPYEDGQGMTFNRAIHNMFIGNAEINLITKLRKYASESGENPRILAFADLVGSDV